MTLWLLMAALTLTAALWLTYPLWQRQTRHGVARTAANVAAYSSRLNELKADIAAGVLPADEAAAIQREMDQRLLADAEHRELIEPESRLMLEGVLRMADLTAGQVMVAAPRMDLINLDAPIEESLHQVIDTGHSRFPVFEGSRDNIIGILMAKDLLKLQRAPELNIRALLRPAATGDYQAWTPGN